MVQKKIPMRQCLGCREMFPKRELIRVVRSPEGELSLDFKGQGTRPRRISVRQAGMSEKRPARAVRSSARLV